MDYLGRNKLKKVGLALLSVVVLGASVMGIANLANNLKTDLKTIHPTFVIGDLDENGEYSESKKALYTKNAFEFTNLEITLDFEHDIEFAVHYYDENGDFLGATENKDKKYSYEKDAAKIVEATHARVVIYPQWTNVEKEDQKVTYFNKLSFSSQLTIKVADGERIDVRQFTIIHDEVDTETYSFEKGMTWLDFIESEYNLDGIFSFKDEKLRYENVGVIVHDSGEDPYYVRVSDLIDETLTYEQLV